MSWDIIKHLQGHAYDFKLFAPKEKIEELVKDEKLINFKFSFSDIQFKNEEDKIEKMQKLWELIKKEPWAWNKNGTEDKKQKFTKRKIDTNGIVASALHTKGINGEHTFIHWHFLLNSKMDWGNGYYRLKQVILKHSLKLGLIPHFAEPTPLKKDFKINGLMKKTTRFSWFIRSSKNEEFLKYIKFKQKYAIENIRALQQYTLKTGRFGFYYKVMLNLQKRLKKQHLNLILDGISIRDNIPVILDQTEQKAIELIKNKNFTQKAIRELKDSKILEEYFNYCRWGDINKCYILKAIKKNTTLLPVLPKNKKFLENYQKLYKKWHLEKLQEVKEKHLDEYAWEQQKLNKKSVKNKEKIIKKEEQKAQKIEILSIKQILKEDLLKVAKQCKNEKELREKMQELGYKEFGFKKKSGKIIGYQFIPPRETKKIVIKCKDTIDISKIRAILKENYLKVKEGQELQQEKIKSNIEKYKLPEAKYLPIVYIQPNKILEIKEQKENELQERIRKIRERIGAIRKEQYSINQTITTIAREQQQQQRVGGTREQPNGIKTTGFGDIKERVRKRIRSRIFRKMGEFKERVRGGISEFFREWSRELGETIKRGIKAGIQQLADQINKKFVLKKQEEDYIPTNTYPKRKL